MPRNTSSVSATPTIQLGTTHVICPGNNSAIHSHVHLNNTEVAIIHTDSMFLLDYVHPGLIGDPLPPIFATVWNKRTVPFFLLFIFPIISMRSVTFFTKFNVIGMYSKENSKICRNILNLIYKQFYHLFVHLKFFS